MTPEEVMTDKDRLVMNMIRVCKADLEGIGLEITAMNIADVDDHRLEGVREPELYIALLKRIQSANAEAQSRAAQAQARAAAKEESETRRAEVAVRDAANAKGACRRRPGSTSPSRASAAPSACSARNVTRGAGGRDQGADPGPQEQRIEMLREKYRAEILIPADAERERMELQRRRRRRRYGTRAGEIDQLARTIEILRAGGKSALSADIIEHFDKFTSRSPRPCRCSRRST